MGHIDRMILDIFMPKESGGVFYTKLKTDPRPRFRDLKVLGIMVIGDKSDFFKCLDQDSDCLEKPVTKEQLLNKIHEMIG